MNEDDIRKLSISNFKNNNTNTDNDLKCEVSNALNNTEQHLINSKIEKSCNYLLFNILWLNNEKGTLANNDWYSYSKGDIIFSLDLGTINIGTEIRYPHPCVVLYDGGDWLLVIPITQATMDKETNSPIIHKPFEIFTEKTKRRNGNEFCFSKPSVIQVDQIKRISKFRIINKKRLKLRVDLLNQIDNVMLENYLPLKYELFEDLKQAIKKRDNEIQELNTTINKLKNEIKMLKITQNAHNNDTAINS